MPDKILPMPVLNAPSQKGQLLPANLRHNLEANHGVDLSDVMYHVGHEATMLGARAFTTSTDIHLAPGYESHLPHEAWHVVQQRQERRVETAPPVAEGLVQVKEEQRLESSGSN
jgi:hypothetical protein